MNWKVRNISLNKVLQEATCHTDPDAQVDTNQGLIEAQWSSNVLQGTK